MPVKHAILVLGLAVAFSGGCGAKYYTRQADRQVYRIVGDKQDDAFGRHGLFTIDPDPELRTMFQQAEQQAAAPAATPQAEALEQKQEQQEALPDRKSTRLNSSH